MSLRKLHIEGYRSLKDVTWEPGNLNILIGPNGAGKSNLIRALTMIRAMANEDLSNFVQRDGGMVPMLHDNGAGKRIAWRAWLDAGGKTVQSVQYHFAITQLGDSSDYEVTTDRYKRRKRGEQKYAGGFGAKTQGKGDIESRHSKESRWRKDLVRTFTVGEELHETGAVCVRVGEWRTYQGVFTGKGSEFRKPVQSRFERELASDGSNLISVLHTLYASDDEFRERIDQGMLAAFGQDYKQLLFPPAADGQIQMRLQWNSLGASRSSADLSDGTLYYLFLLTAMTVPKPAPLIAIDEPELHMHPSMLGLVADYAADAALRSQVILATQSPELLDAFSEIEPVPKVTIVECEEGRTKLHEPSPERLKDWLQKYRLGQMFVSGALSAISDPVEDTDTAEDDQ